MPLRSGRVIRRSHPSPQRVAAIRSRGRFLSDMTDPGGDFRGSNHAIIVRYQMKLFGWLRKRGREDALADWRNDWTAQTAQGAEGDGSLRTRLEALAATEPDVEVELEMLDALDQLRALQRQVAAGSLPSVDTQHRVIGAEICHFTAPASMPTDHQQVDGRVLLTRTKAVFIGGGRTSATPWHMVHAVARIERDVILARADTTPLAHFRFNAYADAVVCAFLAETLKPSRRPRL
jgi:hypothetical protein